MVKCLHESCGIELQEWLPMYNSKDIVKHPWCIRCGLVKNVTEDKAKNIGYWINVLSEISKSYSLKQVQTRIICKELTDNIEFNDSYSATGSYQKELFKKIIKKYIKISPKKIDSIIC